MGILKLHTNLYCSTKKINILFFVLSKVKSEMLLPRLYLLCKVEEKNRSLHSSLFFPLYVG